MMKRINVLLVLAAMLAGGLGMIVVLIQIFPDKADGQLPMALTGSGMVTVGFIAAGVVMRLMRRID
jgi:hypothetical protein